MSRAEFSNALDRIYSVKPGQASKLDFLLSVLKDPNGVLREAAVQALERCFDPADYESELLHRLETEESPEVVSYIISAIASNHAGSGDKSLAQRLVNAVSRFRSDLTDHDWEALHIGLIRIFDGVPSTDLYKMTLAEYSRRALRIRELLGAQEADLPCPTRWRRASL